MAKKRRFGKKVTLFRSALDKLDVKHRVPHVAQVIGEAMGLTAEKIAEEIGIATALFGHLVSSQEHQTATTTRHKFCEDADTGCKHCKGKCRKVATTTLKRNDMADRTGTRFCDECAADALASGVFT